MFAGTVEPPKRWAAGRPAVAVSLRHGLERMGPRRTFTTLRALNQPDGFDCPGCAWPEPGKPHLAEFCENGVKAVAEEATTERITPAFFASHSIADLRERSEHWLGQQGRLTSPMVKRSGGTHYEPIGWDEAFAMIAAELAGLPTPDAAAFYTSGRTSNEAAFLYQLLARSFGTNNLPDCSNMCHEASGSALIETIGIGKGSVHITDFAEADLIVVVGQNPGTNHPRMLSTLEEAKRHGASIVAINPLPEAGLIRFRNPQRLSGMLRTGTELADDHLPIRINGDLAFFKAVNHLLLAETGDGPTGIDRTFIDEHTSGFAEFAAAAADFDWTSFERATGFDRSIAEGFADRVRRSERIIVCWAMGLTQHANSVATIREVVNLLLLGGNIGRPGAGVCPVRGHSNVQGDRTMGIVRAALDRVPRRVGRGVLVRAATRARVRHGRHHPGDARRSGHVLHGHGRQLRFGHARHGRCPPRPGGLPAHGAGVDQAQRLAPRGRRSGVDPADQGTHRTARGRRGRAGRHGRGLDGRGARLTRLAAAGVAGPVERGRDRLPHRPCARRVDRRTVRRARRPPTGDGSSATTPRCATRSAGSFRASTTSTAKIAEPGGFTLPHGPRDARHFATADGRAHFTVNELSFATAPTGTLLLQTLRSHDQYNTTIYGLDDRYRGIQGGRRVVFVSRADLVARGLSDGDVVDLRSTDGEGVQRIARGFRVVDYPTPPGSCAAYYPETNVLVPLHSVGEAGTPTFKSIPVELLTPT